MGNIVLNKTTTASSFVMPYSASKAVDGQATPFSRWLCNTLPGWMEVDTGSVYLVNRWVVRHLPVAGWASPDYANVDFTFQGSNNNSNWVNIDSVTNNSAGITDRTFATPVAFRFFRVNFTKGLRTNTQMASMVELEVYQAYSGQLINLAISSGTLTPAFNTNTYAYTATVAPDVASINVTPTALSPTAVIKVNGTIAACGQPSPVALSPGSNTITVNVTDGAAIQNYTITVTRQSSSYLSSLTVQSRSGAISLTPPFVKTTQNYTAGVANSITSATFTPTAENPSATITINGTVVASGQVSPSFNLAEGNNTFTIIVTSGGVGFTYIVVIAKAYNLLLNKADIAYVYRGGSGSTTVTMDSTNLDYSVNLPNSPGSMTIAPFAASANTVVKVNGTVVPSGTPSVSIAITSGMVVPITVSSPDNTQTRSYTLTVTK